MLELAVYTVKKDVQCCLDQYAEVWGAMPSHKVLCGKWGLS